MDNNRVGVFVDRGGRTTINSNTIEGNAFGINLSRGGGGNIIRSNTINDNIFGINSNSPNDLVRGNTVTNGKFGIRMINNKTGSLLQSNTALGNSNRDVEDNNNGVVAPPCVNTWKNNTFVIEVDPQGCIQ